MTSTYHTKTANYLSNQVIAGLSRSYVRGRPELPALYIAATGSTPHTLPLLCFPSVPNDFAGTIEGSQRSTKVTVSRGSWWGPFFAVTGASNPSVP